MSGDAPYTTRTTCRVCHSDKLTPLFSLGEQFVSDFVTADKIQSGQRCPIELELCGNCSLVQAKHTAPQDFLYSRHYWFRSSTTQTIRDALRDVAATAEHLVNLQPGDVVLDIGSNTGDLLRSYTAPGIVRVGVEPANNLAEEGRVGIECLIRDFWEYRHYLTAAYWSKVTLRWERLPKAKVITATGMLYDLCDPNAFVADVAKALAPDGVFIAQLMCLKQMLDLGDVSNAAHEHLEFYSLRSLEYLFGQHGLEIFDVESNDVNGGSYRLFVRHGNGPVLQTHDAHRRMHTAFTAEQGLDDPATHATFFDRVRANRDACVSFLREQHAAGKRIHVLGSSTKGNVILQWYGLGIGSSPLGCPSCHSVAITMSTQLPVDARRCNSCGHAFDVVDGVRIPLIEAASERSPEKCGLFTIGTGISIISEEQSRAMNPDIYLVLPYSFKVEVMQREKAWHDGGGRFVFPLPQFEVV